MSGPGSPPPAAHPAETDPAHCPDDRVLRRILDADSGVEADLESVCTHIDGCLRCQQRLQNLESLDDLRLGQQDHGATAAAAAIAAAGGPSDELEGFVRKLWQGYQASSQSTQVQHAMAAVRRALDVTGLGAGPVGPYRIERCTGTGGMSVVYQAIDTRLNRTVALKMLSERPGDEASGRRARIAREAAALARLSHPHIVPLYEVLEHQGQLVLVLEFIAGGPLARWLAGRPRPATEAAAAVRTLAQAVQYAHEQGVIHRDLKPGNILLRPLSDAPGPPHAEGAPRPLADYHLLISDFGLARLRDDTAERLTLPGQPVGTPAYMAPEQIQDQGPALGPGTDVYALGALLYELLTGRPPLLASTTAGTLQLIATAEPVPPRRLEPSVPRDLETIALKCLEKDPKRRYPTGAALADDLQRFLEHRPIAARPVGWPGRVARWARRNPSAAASGALALALLLALTLGGFAAALVQRRLRAQAESREQQALRAEAQTSQAHLAAIFQLDTLATGFRQLGPTPDYRIQSLREQSGSLGVQWCQQYLAAWPDSTGWDAQTLQVAAVLVRLQALRGQTAAAQALVEPIHQAVNRLANAAYDTPERALQAQAAAFSSLARVELALDQPTEALISLERVDAALAQRLARTPDVPDLVGQQFIARGLRAQALERLGQPDQALAVALASLPPLRQLQAPNPDALRFWRLQHAQRTLELADRLIERHQTDPARTLLAQGLEHLDHCRMTQAGRDAEFQTLRDALLRRWVGTLADASPDALAPALAELRTLTAHPDPSPLRPLDLDLARHFLDLRRPATARPLARTAAAAPTLTPAAAIDLAALFSALADHPDPDPDPDRTPTDHELSLALLERAQAAGALADAPARTALGHRPEFSHLHADPRFQRLLQHPGPATPPAR